MKDDSKTKKQLISELEELRQRIDQLEKLGAKQKQVEAELANERHLFSTIMDNIPDAIYFKDIDGRFIRINKAHATLFGLKTPDQALGKTDFDFFSEDHAQPAYEDEQEIIKTGQPILNLEEKETWPDGRETWALTSKMPLCDEGGKIIGTFGISRDITDRKRVRAALKKSEKLYRDLIEKAGIAVLIDDIKGRIRYFNKRLPELFGYTEDEIKKLSINSLVHPDDVKRVIDIHKRRIKSEDVTTRYDFKGIKKDGTPVWIEVDVVILEEEEEEGEPVGTRSYLWDITKHKEIENALKESDQRHFELINKAPDGIVVSDIFGNTILTNPALEKITGYNSKEMLGKNFSRIGIVAKEFLPKALKELALAAIGKKRPPFEINIIRKDNRIVPVEAHINFLQQEEGSNQVQVIIRDITDRKKMETARLTSEAQFLNLARTATDAIVQMDEKGRISFWNETASQMFGYENKEVLGSNIHEILAPDYLREKAKKGLDRFLKTGKGAVMGKTVELETFRKDGTKFPVELSLSGMKIGNAWHAIGIVRDISDRKEMESKLVEAFESKSRFTSMVSHELRTPLTAIKEGIGIVLDGSAGEINEVQTDFLDTAKRNVDRLHRLINDILDFTKLESGKMEFNMELSDITKIINEVISNQSYQIKKKDLVLKTDLGSDLPLLRYDSDKIMQVMTNLINNAIKYTATGGITISSKRSKKNDNIRVSVKDTGMGIPEEDSNKLFEAFQQVGDKSYRRPGSTGLGLAICKEIVIGHGGKIWVESEEGSGSEFIFTLPISR